MRRQTMDDFLFETQTSYVVPPRNTTRVVVSKVGHVFYTSVEDLGPASKWEHRPGSAASHATHFQAQDHARGLWAREKEGARE